MKSLRKNEVLGAGVTVLFLFGFAFFFNFIWEAVHAVYLYREHDFNASTYIPMLLYVSSVDGLLIEGLFLATGLVWRNLLWIKKFTYARVLFFCAGGIFTAGIIEYRAVYWTDRWAYNPNMPTIAGIGLSPLVQLAVTGMLSVWLTKEVLYGRGLMN